MIFGATTWNNDLPYCTARVKVLGTYRGKHNVAHTDSDCREGRGHHKPVCGSRIRLVVHYVPPMFINFFKHFIWVEWPWRPSLFFKISSFAHWHFAIELKLKISQKTSSIWICLHWNLKRNRQLIVKCSCFYSDCSCFMNENPAIDSKSTIYRSELWAFFKSAFHARVLSAYLSFSSDLIRDEPSS